MHPRKVYCRFPIARPAPRQGVSLAACVSACAVGVMLGIIIMLAIVRFQS